MNFSGVVIISHEVMKVESFEATKCGIQHDPGMFKTFHFCFSLHVFANLIKKKHFIQLYGCFDHFLKKVGSCKILHD